MQLVFGPLVQNLQPIQSVVRWSQVKWIRWRWQFSAGILHNWILPVTSLDSEWSRKRYDFKYFIDIGITNGTSILTSIVHQPVKCECPSLSSWKATWLSWRFGWAGCWCLAIGFYPITSLAGPPAIYLAKNRQWFRSTPQKHMCSKRYS